MRGFGASAAIGQRRRPDLVDRMEPTGIEPVTSCLQSGTAVDAERLGFRVFAGNLAAVP
jgi:hypothetical protein